MPEAAAPSKKRAANAVATLEARGGQSAKTRRGMAAAGEQPTVATTGRMLLVEDMENVAKPVTGTVRLVFEEDLEVIGLLRGRSVSLNSPISTLARNVSARIGHATLYLGARDASHTLSAAVATPDWSMHRRQ